MQVPQPQTIQETSRGLPVGFLVLLSLAMTLISIIAVVISKMRINKLTEGDEVFDHTALAKSRMLYDRSVSALVVFACATIVCVAVVLFRVGSLDDRLNPFQLERIFDE